MAVTNPFSITYGTRQVGGSTSYLLHGPYIIDKNHDRIRLVFDVVVAGTSHSNLQSLANDLETDFRKRLTHGQTLVIDLNGSAWTYTHGTNIFNLVSSIAKTGNPESDRGFSRSYTVTIEGDLPADVDAGLRDLEVNTQYTQSRQRVVTMRGTYTGISGTDAQAQYVADFDAEATLYLDAIGPSPVVWELVDESFSMDRQRDGSNDPFPHLCNFSRQYVELLVDQSSGTRDETNVRDHRVVFTDLSQHPGDSVANIYRLRRVEGSYDCAVDIEQITDLHSVYDNQVRDHVVSLFQTNFNPKVYAVEGERVSYDESSKRLSVSITFIYQKAGGDAIVEVSQSLTYREARTIDYTPVHEADELAAEADVGWATVERVWQRTVVVIGTESPKLRIAEKPLAGDAGLMDQKIAGVLGPDAGSRRKVVREGWNIIQNTSRVSPQMIGDPDDVQIEGATLVEIVVERYHRRPSTRTVAPIQTTPVTPKK